MMQAQDQTTKKYHHGNLREELLNAANELLEEHGMEGISLRAVAAKVGVSHSAPYRHFKSKMLLLSAIAQQGFEQLTQAINSAANQFPDEPENQIQAAGMAYIKLAVKAPKLSNLMFSGVLPCDDAHIDLEIACNNSFGALQTIIANGQKKGIFRDMTLEELTLAAWSAVHGMAVLITAGQLQYVLEDENITSNLAYLSTKTILHGMLK